MISLLEKMQVVEEMLDGGGGIGLWQFDGNRLLIRCSASDQEALSLFMKLGGAEECLFQNAEESQYPAIVTDEFLLTWLMIPHKVERTTVGVFVIGPVFSSAISENMLLDRLHLKEIGKDWLDSPTQIIRQIPVIPHQLMMHYAQLVYRLIYGERIGGQNIRMVSSNSQDEPEEIVEIRKRDEDYSLELEIMRSVEQGNIHYVHPQSTLTVEVGKLSRGSALRQVQNTMISSITLVTRAAIRGGMSVSAAYTLSDFYILASENCHNVTEVYSNWQTCINDFTQRVHEIRCSSHSAPVNQVISYVELHAAEPLKVSDIAEIVGYSKNYLGSMFHNEMGITLTQFITNQKLEIAAMKLVGTQKSISEISHSMSFESVSYFSAQFRKCYGVTPAEYRKRNGAI